MRALGFGLVSAAVAAACGPSNNNGGGQCKDALIAGDLVITEVFADYQAPAGGSGADEGKEWFEIYNASDRPLDLTGLTIVHSRPDDSKANTHTVSSLTIPPGEYLVLGNAAPDLVPPYVSYGYGADLGDFFNTDGGKLALKCGDAEIDSAVYDTVKAGHSRELTAAQPPDYTLNDDLAQWCQGNDLEFDAGNFGTPGQDNDCTPVVVGQCTDANGMRDTVLPGAGDLVITEVMPNPAATSDTTGEWFEVQAAKDVDVNGVGLDRAGDTANPIVLDSPMCLHIAAGDRAIFARSSDMTMNGGLPAAPLLGTFTFALVDGTAAAPGDVQLLAGTTVIDAIHWTSTRSGASHSLDPTHIDAIANDDESNFCDATSTYGAGDKGTPALANDACPVTVPPGMCDDAGTLRPIVKPAAGKLVISEIMINPKVETTPGAQEWIEITNTGTTAFDLNELGIDQAAGTRPPDVINASACKSVPAGGFALFVHTTDPATNGGNATFDATYGFTLSNSGGDVQIMDGATVLDAVTWGSVSAGSFDAKSIQIDPDHLNTTDNDTLALTAGAICLGATGYGDMTNQGTPRAANAQCP
jgi:lamin tail-like protein